MMKRIGLLFLILIMTISFSACSEEKENKGGSSELKGEDNASVSETTQEQNKTESNETQPNKTEQSGTSDSNASNSTTTPESNTTNGDAENSPSSTETSSSSDEESNGDSATESETDNYPANIFDCTYEQYHNMSAEKQQEFFNQFPSMEAFFDWYNKVKDKYEKESGAIDFGNGEINLDEVIGK